MAIAINSNAQDYYSYISDRKFTDPTDLIGFKFCPSSMEIPQVSKRDVAPCSFSFGITTNNLYVQGEEIKGVYEINNINTTEYGFKVTHINARDARIQGHLKVILNTKNQVDALVFRRSSKDKEIIFFLPKISEDLKERDEKYFTDLWEMKIEHPDSLWGKKVFPFISLYQNELIQERHHPKDSIYFQFIEKITIVEKEKIKKPKKIKKKELENEGLPLDTLSADTVVKTKIIKEYFVKISFQVRNKDGEIAQETKEFQVKKVAERTDEEASGREAEKYLIEFTTQNGRELNLYLTQERTISSFEAEGRVYFTRGH